MLIVKAYLARFASETEALGDSQINSMFGVFDDVHHASESTHKPKRYQGKTSRYDSRAALRSEHSSVWKELQKEAEEKGDVTPWKYPGYHSIYRARREDPKQRTWYFFDNALIIPEYLIEYEYVFESDEMKSVFAFIQIDDVA